MHRTAANGHAVLIMNSRKNGAGVDYIADISGADGIENFLAALAELASYPCAYSVFLKEVCRADCGLDVEAQLIKSLNKRQSLFLILIGKGDKYGAVFLDLNARGLKRPCTARG